MFDCIQNRNSVTFASAIALVACGGSQATTLRPAATATSAPDLQSAATATDHNVEVTVQSKGWPGPARIAQKVTPLRVIIHNAGEQDVRVSYANFVLMAPDGSRFAALPPLKVEGEVPAGTVVVNTPGFLYSGFEVAPYLGPAYPSLSAWNGTFYSNLGYYDRYYSAWQVEAELPTQEMIDRALPEGVLKPNGRIDGYLYFEHVPDDEGSVHFQATLPRVEAERAQASVSIPFQVME